MSPLPSGQLARYGEALHEPTGSLFWPGTEAEEICTGYVDGAMRADRAVAIGAARRWQDRGER